MYNLFETLLYVSDCLGTVVASGPNEIVAKDVSEALERTTDKEDEVA